MDPLQKSYQNRLKTLATIMVLLGFRPAKFYNKFLETTGKYISTVFFILLFIFTSTYDVYERVIYVYPHRQTKDNIVSIISFTVLFATSILFSVLLLFKRKEHEKLFEDDRKLWDVTLKYIPEYIRRSNDITWALKFLTVLHSIFVLADIIIIVVCEGIISNLACYFAFYNFLKYRLNIYYLYVYSIVRERFYKIRGINRMLKHVIATFENRSTLLISSNLEIQNMVSDGLIWYNICCYHITLCNNVFGWSLLFINLYYFCGSLSLANALVNLETYLLVNNSFYFTAVAALMLCNMVCIL